MLVRRRPIRISPAGLSVLVATACSPAAAPRSEFVEPLPLSCDEFVNVHRVFSTGLARSDYLYTCRLAEAFRDYVAERRGCRLDDECVFVAGHCAIHGSAINRQYGGEVTKIRDRVAAAYGAVAGCTSCGGTGVAVKPRCVDSLCEMPDR